MSQISYSNAPLNKMMNRSIRRLFCSGVGAWSEDLSTPLKHNIEKYWKDKLHVSNESSRSSKYYVLSMFPYPSGKLHMGHVRVYTISDTMARFHRMNGKQVIHPMGWDAFGLPAENAAIERQVEPSSWTKQNIRHMKEQLIHLGCSFDWDREIATCDPEYYRWTQYLFLRMHEEGLVYRKEALVNWDPVDKTVLADEQVDENGCSWRSGAKVEKKVLKQWFIRTTRFAKDLWQGLDDPVLQNWRDIVKIQRHWIGECSGTNMEFEVVSSSSEVSRTLTVWTGHPEHIYGVRFVAVKPGSILDLLESDSGKCRKLSVQVLNPFSKELLPVFVSDQVDYADGTDCHLGMPDVSETDRLFAIAANLPASSVPEEDETRSSATGTGVPTEAVEVVRERVCRMAKERGVGGYPCSSKLRDWLISRQRYWGTPIPMVHCSTCSEPQPVPYKELPIMLPSAGSKEAWLNTACPRCGGKATRETDTMDTFVDSSWYFLRFLDPHNKEAPFSRELANKYMPVDLYIGGKEHAVLHLYYARFFNHFLYSIGLVPHREPFKQLLVQGLVMGRTYRVQDSGKYIPADQVEYSGKTPVEKGTGKPLLVSWEKMSKSKHNGVDPETMFQQYGTDTTRLLILADVAPASQRNWNSAIEYTLKGFTHHTISAGTCFVGSCPHHQLLSTGCKQLTMWARAYENMFLHLLCAFPGILKWQHRLWLTIRNFIEVRKKVVPSDNVKNTPRFRKEEDIMFDNRNFYVKGATHNYVNTFQLSVALSKMQGLTNSIRRAPPEVVGMGLQFERALACQIILLAPMAPHFASELWSGFVSAPNRVNTCSDEVHWDRNVLEQPWPQVDDNYCLPLTCMVNGNEVTTIRIPKYQLDTLTHDDALELALVQRDLHSHVSGRKIIRTFFKLQPSYNAVLSITTESDKLQQRQAQDG